MRQLIYAAVSLVLIGVFVAAGVLWFRSHEYSEQAVLRWDPVRMWQQWRAGGTEEEVSPSATPQDQAQGDTASASLSVWTTDRGQLGMLWFEMSAGQPLATANVPAGTRAAWIWEWRTNQASARSTPRLDELCEERGLGFGWGRDVAVSSLERPAVAQTFGGFTPGGGSWWATRRIVLPLWLPMALAAGLWLIWTLTYGLKTHRQSKGACTRCGHDITQSSHYCPQCRKPIPRRTWSGDSRPRRGPRNDAVR